MLVTAEADISPPSGLEILGRIRSNPYTADLITRDVARRNRLSGLLSAHLQRARSQVRRFLWVVDAKNIFQFVGAGPFLQALHVEGRRHLARIADENLVEFAPGHLS